jgi:hypothetical protein
VYDGALGKSKDNSKEQLALLKKVFSEKLPTRHDLVALRYGQNVNT